MRAPGDVGGNQGSAGVGGGNGAGVGGAGIGGGSGGSGAGGADTPGVSCCGPACEPCATSPSVPGGSFYRSYDGHLFPDQGNPATVSSFRLDKYEVTIGRFRQFVAAVVSGWLPASGGGKHTHLNGGLGLADSSNPGTYETGWNAGWNNNLPATTAGWTTMLWCSSYGQWTASPGAHEDLPIDCVNWYQAYAFCIWDGGFLPSEAEWNYAAAGGSEQRAFPWSNPPSDETFDCSYANYSRMMTFQSGACPDPWTVGLASPKGDGKWGQADLAGDVAEWTLDWFAPYARPCNDCAFLSTVAQPTTIRVQRGGSSYTPGLGPQASGQGGPGSYAIGNSVQSSNRIGNDPSGLDAIYGFRCARAP
jgi:formylglycine-generating enzyme required for sulfatase activity